MSRTIEESSCLSNPSFISSSNVLRLVAMLVMTLLLSSLINIQSADAEESFGFKFGTYGQNNGPFYYPSGVAVDSTGRMYVTDWGNYRVQVFDANGNFLFKFGDPDVFIYPEGIAVDSTGNIYVVDTGNSHRRPAPPWRSVTPRDLTASRPSKVNLVILLVPFVL